MTSLLSNNNNFEIPQELLKKAAESALVSSFVELNTAKVSSQSTYSSLKSPNGRSYSHKVVIDLDAKTSQSQDSHKTSVFIKVVPKTSPTFSSIEKEIKIYEGFLKELQQRKNNRKAGQQISFLPKCYLTQINEENGMIFLENLKALGFQNYPNKELDFNHALLAVETLARFHSSSYFLRRQLGSKGKGTLEILSKFPYLKQNTLTGNESTTNSLRSIFAKFFDQIVVKIVESDNPSLAFKLRRKFPEPAKIWDKMGTILENEKYENDDFYVACHGDFRIGNLLFKYASSKEPIECRMVDFKQVKFAPIASDLTYFFLTSTTGKMRDEFEEKLLAFYCDTFEEHLKLRYEAQGLSIQDFDIEDFHRKLENQYRRMLEYGFYNASLILPLLLCNANSREELTFSFSFQFLLEEQDRFDCKEDFDKFVKECLNSEELKQRILSIVKQLFKNRII